MPTIQGELSFVTDSKQRAQEVVSSLQRRAREMGIDLHGTVNAAQAESVEKAHVEASALDQRHAEADAGFSVDPIDKARAVWDGLPPAH